MFFLMGGRHLGPDSGLAHGNHGIAEPDDINPFFQHPGGHTIGQNRVSQHDGNDGVIAGYQVQNVCVEVHFGKHHPVDSSEQAFKTAASMAFRNVFQQAKPALLEPIVKIEVTVPGDNVGDISSDMSGRRGRVLGMDSAGGDLQTVTAEVPLAEVTTYAQSLNSITGGHGSYTIEFSHYDIVPGNVQQQIIQQAAKLKEEED